MKRSKIIVATIISLLLGIESTQAEEYKVLFGEANAFPPLQYDQNGFNTSGIHKDTGTIYDGDGYDVDGWNSAGYGRDECHESSPGSSYGAYEARISPKYDASYNITGTYLYMYWNASRIDYQWGYPKYGYENKYYPQRTIDGFVYYASTERNSYYIGRGDYTYKFDICRKAIKP